MKIGIRPETTVCAQDFLIAVPRIAEEPGLLLYTFLHFLYDVPRQNAVRRDFLYTFILIFYDNAYAGNSRIPGRLGAQECQNTFLS